MFDCQALWGHYPDTQLFQEALTKISIGVVGNLTRWKQEVIVDSFGVNNQKVQKVHKSGDPVLNPVNSKDAKYVFTCKLD